jgi:hypothetical protein
LLEDVTEEDRQRLRVILISSRVEDMTRLVVQEIKDLLEGYTSEADSAQIHQLLSFFGGLGLDDVLSRLESSAAMGQEPFTAWLFGDLDRANAERVRRHFFQFGGPRAMQYAAIWTATKIHSLLAAYTGRSASHDILWNFQTIDAPEQRTLVQTRLNTLTLAAWGKTAEQALMEEMDASPYEALRQLDGLRLSPYAAPAASGVAALADVAFDWGTIVLQWYYCGLAGVATGVLSVVWDLVKLVTDVVIAVWDLLWSLVYLLSGGAAGSDNWLAVKNFFVGIGRFFTDPGKVFDKLWEELTLEFQTLEGTFADCRRAEFIVRKFMNALVNILLIYLAGYGIVKGVASGVQAAAEFAELASIVGVRGAISLTSRLAIRGIRKFVKVTAQQARRLAVALRQPQQVLALIRVRVNVVLLAAQDEGYWNFLRRQARTLGEDVAAGERRFWEQQRRYWRERALRQEQQRELLHQLFGQVDENLTRYQAPEDAEVVIGSIGEQAAVLDQETGRLYAEVTGEGQPRTAPEPAVRTEPRVPVGVAPATERALGYPPSTAESETVAHAVRGALLDSNVPPPQRGIALGVYVHRDGSVTIAPSGRQLIEPVRNALAGRVPGNWVVGPAEITPQMIHPEGLRPWTTPGGQVQPGRATCSECRLSVGGRANPSPVEGMTVLQWGGDEPLRFTDVATDIMRPCESCATNVDRIMEPIQVVPRTRGDVPPAALIALGAGRALQPGEQAGEEELLVR